MPDIANGVVIPVSDTVDFGSDYAVTCNNGYTASSKWAMNCTADGTLDSEHTCDSKPLINYIFPAVFIENSHFQSIRTFCCLMTKLYLLKEI